MGAEHWDAQVGSVADEAVRLLESLRRTAAETAPAAERGAGDPAAASGAPRGRGDGTASGGPPAPATGQQEQHEQDEHAGPPSCAEHDPVCQWCPICRGAAVVRSLSPETLARLADLASLASGVLVDLAGARAGARAAGEPGAPDAAGGLTRPATPQPPASRPIPVRDADDAQEAPRG